MIAGTQTGTCGADSVKAKADFTWAGAADGVSAEVLTLPTPYDRLFTDPQPDAGGKNLPEALNPDSLKVVTAVVEPSLAAAKPDQNSSLSGTATLWRTGRTTAWAGKWCSNG